MNAPPSRWLRRSRPAPSALQYVADRRYDERARGWARRYLPAAVLGCVGGYLAGFGLAGWIGGLVGLAVVAAAAGCVLSAVLWRRFTIAVVAAVATIAVVGAIVGDIYAAAGLSGDATVTAAGLWCLTLVGLLGAWKVRRHAGSRAVTSLLCDGVVIVAALLSGINSSGAVVLAILGIVAILAVRGGLLLSLRVRRAQKRSRLVPRELPRESTVDITRLADSARDDATLASGLDRERQVAQQFSELDPQAWTALHSRRLPGTGDIIEHLLVGPSGIVVCTTAHWRESVVLTDIRKPDGNWSAPPGIGHEVYTLDGSSELLARRLEPILVATRQVAWTLDIHPDELRCVVIFADGSRQLPEPVVDIDLLRLWDPQRSCPFDATAYLVSLHALVGFLLGLPRRSNALPGRLSRVSARLRHADPDVSQQVRDARYARDVATICDQLFEPVR